MKKKTNYIPGTISFTDGFTIGGEKRVTAMSKGKPFMAYDDKKTKAVIKELIASGRKIVEGVAGLDGDWGSNNSTVYENGEFKEYEAHHGSLWATPILIVTFEDGPSETFDVFSTEETNGNL